MLVISGEAGIGKTTMLAHLTGAATAAGIPVLAGRGDADEGAPAFWPWRRVLARGGALGLSPDLLETDAGPPGRGADRAIARPPPRSPTRAGRPLARSATCSGRTWPAAPCCATSVST